MTVLQTVICLLFIISYSEAYSGGDVDDDVDNVMPFKNLVLEGGGAKAISYIGALKAFKDVGYFSNNVYTFENISGSSVGCFIGLLVALDIDPLELELIVYKKNILSEILAFDLDLFNDADISPESSVKSSTTFSWFNSIMTSYNLILKATRLMELWSYDKSPGLSIEEKFLKFMNETILPLSPYREKLQLTFTFTDLMVASGGHQLTCYASRLVENIPIEFSPSKSPKEQVLKALYASITIPGIFKPIDDSEGYPLIDGGIFNNFPIYSYDFNGKLSKSTLGLSLGYRSSSSTIQSNNKQHTSVGIYDPNIKFGFKKLSTFEYAALLHSAITDRNSCAYKIDECNIDRIVYLESPLRVLDYNVDALLKALAINRAYLNTIAFFR